MTTHAASVPITEPACAAPGPEASKLCRAILLCHEPATCSLLMPLARASKHGASLYPRRIHERSFVAPAFTLTQE